MACAGPVPDLRFHICGQFHVLDPKGRDVTPKGRKTQAVLALLVTSDTGGRTRAWLQDKLWSDRGPEQGAGSLRQALCEIRRSFGPAKDTLQASRNAVWLDQSRITVNAKPAGLDKNAELFEGLDVRDDEFDLWLVSLRANAGYTSDTGAGLGTPDTIKRKDNAKMRQIILNLQNAGQGEIGFIEEITAEAVKRNLREQADFDVHTSAPPATHPDALVIEIQCFAPTSGGFAIRAALQTVADGKVLWSDIHPTATAPTFESTPPEILAFSTIIAGRIFRAFLMDRVSNDFDPDANVLALLAMQKVFLLRADEAQNAEAMLEAAYERRQRGVYQAWLAQINTISFIEGFAARDEMASSAEQTIALALETEGENSQVLTVAANCALVFDRDPQLAGHLARTAVRANPANAMAWWVLGHVQLYCGQYDESYHTSCRGQVLARGTFLQYWLDFQKAFAAAFCGKLDEARIHGQASSILRPEFRAAHRFALALNTASGDDEHARYAFQKLRKLEEGFSPSRFVNDEDYPVSLIRSTPFYNTRKLLEFEAKL
ncbi:hypothetical protein [Yoonia sp. SDW83-1]|uniref:hypothetical protein n=1 Tax=Yoonia sp. SDW83-1 TaxID=3366945 RepID=UPI00398C311D